MSIKLEDFKPEFVGRGQWHLVHTLASKAKTPKEISSTIWAIRTLVLNLRCEECFKHATEYVFKHPPENEADNLFKWTYEFHKTANNYAGKTSPSYEEVQRFYFTNNDKCQKGCSEKGGSSSPNYIE